MFRRIRNLEVLLGTTTEDEFADQFVEERETNVGSGEPQLGLLTRHNKSPVGQEVTTLAVNQESGSVEDDGELVEGLRHLHGPVELRGEFVSPFLVVDVVQVTLSEVLGLKGLEERVGSQLTAVHSKVDTL